MSPPFVTGFRTSSYVRSRLPAPFPCETPLGPRSMALMSISRLPLPPGYGCPDRPSGCTLGLRHFREPPPLCLFPLRSEEHTSELQSLMRISYAVFCLKKKKQKNNNLTTPPGVNT